MSGIYYAASDLITGSNGSQVIATLENPSSNTLPIMLVEPSINGIPGSLSGQVFLYRLARTTGLPTGGTPLPIAKQNTTEVDANAIVRISPSVAVEDASLWTNCPGVVLSSLGTFVPNPVPEIIIEPENYGLIINPGEAIAILTTAASAGWSHWTSFLWTES